MAPETGVEISEGLGLGEITMGTKVEIPPGIVKKERPFVTPILAVWTYSPFQGVVELPKLWSLEGNNDWFMEVAPRLLSAVLAPLLEGDGIGDADHADPFHVGTWPAAVPTKLWTGPAPLPWSNAPDVKEEVSVPPFLVRIGLPSKVA
jgi:hypothetical protein